MGDDNDEFYCEVIVLKQRIYWYQELEVALFYRKRRNGQTDYTATRGFIDSTRRNNGKETIKIVTETETPYVVVVERSRNGGYSVKNRNDFYCDKTRVRTS